MKIQCTNWPVIKKLWATKTFRIMRLTMYVFILAVVQGYASNSYAQATKLNLALENSSIREVLLEIEDNSEFRFLYNSKMVDVDRSVSVEFSDLTINKAMDKLFKGTEVDYRVIDRQVVLFSENESFNNFDLQQRTVSGTVTDLGGQPLPGVTVLIKGTTQGTVTNSNGEYALTAVPDNAILVYSFVGMRSQEILAEDQTIINVTMEQDVIGIEEVVAIGYGSVKKSDLTGAVGTIQGDAIAERRTTQVSQALQGAMPGVMVTRNNNAPGSTATIRIRGITTIGENNPLIIVDGVPVNNINDINPNDIQDISVLKDAASASIYGSRAAAGVILVTTKRARAGEIYLDYNAEYGVETPTQIPEYVDVTRYMQVVNELRWNDNGNNDNEYPLYPKDLVDNYVNLNAENPDLHPNTDWVDLLLKDNAPRQSHNLSISAGTNSIRTKLSLAYDKTDALYMGRSYERITSRFNNDININKFLSATLDMYFKRSISEQPSIDPMYHMLIAAPVYAAEWADGRVAGGKDGHNTYGQIKYGGYRNNCTTRLEGKCHWTLLLLKDSNYRLLFHLTLDSIRLKISIRKYLTLPGMIRLL
jgi:TonB-linked SusC/RagA family outer membrane protein